MRIFFIFEKAMQLFKIYNGNILQLSRNGHTNSEASTFGLMDNLSYVYDNGNQLQSVTDAANTTFGFKDGNTVGNDYSYDANGNLTADKNKNITSIKYNHLNLPIEVQFNNDANKKISYIYDAAWKHGGKVLTSKEIKILSQNGWKLPK